MMDTETRLIIDLILMKHGVRKYFKDGTWWYNIQGFVKPSDEQWVKDWHEAEKIIYGPCIK